MNIRQIPEAVAAAINSIHDAMTPQEQSFVSREAIVAVIAAQGRAPGAAPAVLVDWFEAQRIADVPAIDEAIRDLVQDPTGDNATCLVRDVIAQARAGKVDPIAAIIAFNVDAGNSADVINTRQSALYLGLQFEELGEKASACGLHAVGEHLSSLAGHMKRGSWDKEVEAALKDPTRREAMLDADLDLVVVSVGAAISQGANVPAGLAEVCRSNDAKRGPDGKLSKDGNGKIQKPAGWTAPDLRPFIGREFPVPF